MRDNESSGGNEHPRARPQRDGATSFNQLFAGWLAVAVLLALYLITWIWGVAAVNTEISMDVYDKYKYQLRQPNSQVRDKDPSIHISASIVVLPGVILTWYDYMSAPLAGEGIFRADLWAFDQSRNILSWRLWMS